MYCVSRLRRVFLTYLHDDVDINKYERNITKIQMLKYRIGFKYHILSFTVVNKVESTFCGPLYFTLRLTSYIYNTQVVFTMGCRLRCYILLRVTLALTSLLINNRVKWFPLKEFLYSLLNKSTVPVSHGRV